jgi:hypothetical protein
LVERASLIHLSYLLNLKYRDELEPINERWDSGVVFNAEEEKYEWAKRDVSKDEYFQWRNARLIVCKEDLVTGMDAVARAYKTSWWEWEDGSRPFHWRWPDEYQERIRDGIRVHFKEDPPRYTAAQRDVKDPKIKEKVKEKLQKVRMRRYIAEGYVVSLTSFFEVPKGEDDIRMVYDGSVGGLNDAMWVPRFVLSTLNAHLRAMEKGTFMGDLDVGECFLNFMLHPTLRPYAGVDFTLFFPLAEEGVELDPDGKPSAHQTATVWETWLRAAMGLKSSPYQAVQGLGFAEEVVRGDRRDPKNVF